MKGQGQCLIQTSLDSEHTVYINVYINPGGNRDTLLIISEQCIPQCTSIVIVSNYKWSGNKNNNKKKKTANC